MRMRMDPMRSNPWINISKPTRQGQINALRIDSDHPLELFRTRDHKGRIGLSIQFKEALALPSGLPRLQGFSIWAGEAPTELRLTLLAENDWEPFLALSEDLARTCATCSGGQQALDSILSRIERWQRLLARDRSGLLSEQEVRGLFGELTFLHDELLPRYGSRAVEFWNGPEGCPQDFSIFSTVVEIKTRTGGGPGRVRISSPEQLWPSLPSMYLCVYFLAVDAPGGMSLNDLVSRIRTQLDDPGHLSTFERRLESVGYLDLPEYDSSTLLADWLDTFHVGPGFPCITPSSVPVGVTHLSYDLGLDHCGPFIATVPWPASGD